MEKLTKKEMESFKILVRLGDSEELALETVLKEREKEDASEFYKQGYEI